MNVASWLASAVLFVLPAYVANGSPVVMARIVKRRHPIDFGKKFVDGRRVLGDSKSIEGFVCGVATGTLTGFVEGIVFGNPSLWTWRGLLLSVGAMVGDCVGSFIKRRMGLAPGKPMPLLDQLTFLLFAMAFAYLGHAYTLSLGQALFLVAITPVIHYATNVVAYKLKLKEVPW